MAKARERQRGQLLSLCHGLGTGLIYDFHGLLEAWSLLVQGITVTGSRNGNHKSRSLCCTRYCQSSSVHLPNTRQQSVSSRKVDSHMYLDSLNRFISCQLSPKGKKVKAESSEWLASHR